MFQLIIYRGRVRQRSLDLTEGQWVVGRSPEADVVIDDLSVSRRHLRITVAGRRVVAEDLDTRNCTFINGVAMPIRDLAVGDRIELGPWALQVVPWAAANDTLPPSSSGAPTDVHSTKLSDLGKLAAQRERTATLLSDHLVQKSGNGLCEHALLKRMITVGFEASNDVTLPGRPLVARTVAEITRDPIGWLVKGVSTFYPVKVNGRKIRDHRLRDGDLIEVRGQQLRFRAAVGS